MSMGSGGIFGAPLPQPWEKLPGWPGQTNPKRVPQPGAGPSDYPITPGGPMTAQKPGINWWGVAADALAGAAGQPGPYAARMAREQDMQAQIAAEQRRQAAAFANFVQQEQWKRANPAAPQPTEFERTVLAGGIQPGTPAYVQIMRQRAENQASAPPLVVPNSDGTRTVYPAGAIPRGATSAAPAAPVGKLTPIVGGAAPQGAVGFPRPVPGAR